MQCNARITWYREPGHVPVEDICALDNGHTDYDHLPAQKAAEQVENRIWNQAVAVVFTAVGAYMADWNDEDERLGVLAIIQGLRR